MLCWSHAAVDPLDDLMIVTAAAKPHETAASTSALLSIMYACTEGHVHDVWHLELQQDWFVAGSQHLYAESGDGVSPHALLTASFDVALTYGGPAIAVWGWIGVSLCVLCVSLNMAELSSAVRLSHSDFLSVFLPACLHIADSSFHSKQGRRVKPEG